MRRNTQLKVAASHIPLRKSVTSGSAAGRRSFPAWVDAAEATATFTAARTAMPRVRVGLVLRRVGRKGIERGVGHGRTR